MILNAETDEILTGSLLAVDLGIKTGLALFGKDGRLRWYRSKNYGSTARLKRDINNLLNSIQDILLLVLEGGGTLATVWEREAKRRNIPVRLINAEQWRKKLLYPRQQLSGPQAKHYAGKCAREIIAWSGLSRPASLRHDAAEAILIGLYAVMDIGWLKDAPPELRRT
jgi:hypothetical protein